MSSLSLQQTMKPFVVTLIFGLAIETRRSNQDHVEGELTVRTVSSPDEVAKMRVICSRPVHPVNVSLAFSLWKKGRWKEHLFTIGKKFGAAPDEFSVQCEAARAVLTAVLVNFVVFKIIYFAQLCAVNYELCADHFPIINTMWQMEVKCETAADIGVILELMNL